MITVETTTVSGSHGSYTVSAAESLKCLDVSVYANETGARMALAMCAANIGIVAGAHFAANFIDAGAQQELKTCVTALKNAAGAIRYDIFRNQKIVLATGNTTAAAAALLALWNEEILEYVG